MSRQFDLTPRQVARVNTGLRQIATPLPVPESLSILDSLHRHEPVSMQGQPPIVWNRAEGFQVSDAWGNRWIDWSSGVLVANAGHGRREMIDAIAAQAASGLLHNYCFPSAIRARTVEKIASLLPLSLDRVFLLTTGSETVECAIKLCRTHGVRMGGRDKNVIISFDKAFHGRTLGSQLAGGIPSLKEWIVNPDKGFAQVPFPDGFRTPDTSFDFFLQSMAESSVHSQNVCGVILETYQGGSAAFAPPAYMQDLRDWCTGHRVLLVCDEVQAGFGRTGTMWGFEHYGIVPDLALFGKGISSSLPLAAVAGRAGVMNLHPAGSMTSTHSGNPIACAAAIASMDLIVNERLVDNARRLGELLHARLRAMKSRYPQIGDVAGKGLVAGVAMVQPGTKEPDADAAFDLVWRTIQKGVLMFAPVGFGGGTVKICPPLCITEAALEESLGAFEEAAAEILGVSFDAAVIGGGMITHDQLLPSLYQLQRLGRVGSIRVCARNRATLDKLAASDVIRTAFPRSEFQATTEPYEQVLKSMAPGQLAVVAVPDPLHCDVILAALRAGLNVCVVKPLVMNVVDSFLIEEEARTQSLFVGIDYHKRFDDRSLIARRAYREGRFGEFRLGNACLHEKWNYRHSNFQNWCTCENSDAFCYIGCHYVDLVQFITGLEPVAVSVYGLRDRYPNGNEGFLWTDARVRWSNGASLNVQNSLGYPEEGPGSNMQGLTMWCSGNDGGAMIRHSDQYRGMEYSYLGGPYSEPSSDYFQYVPAREGLTPVGYGYRSIERIVEACRTGSDEEGIVATPANSRHNERVIEAARKSILDGGREIAL